MPQFRSLEGLDAAKADPMVIRSFLQSGLMEEIPDFVEEFVAGLGDAVRSRLFCQYLMLDFRFNAAIFVKDLGLPQEEFLGAADCLDQLGDSLSAEDVRAYLTRALRRAIELRDRSAQNQYQDVLRRALRFIDQHYDEESISLNTVAEAVNISANYFSAVFSQEMHMTFVEYLTQKRMDKARRLLRQTTQRSGEIAAAVGYRDPRYFSFVFKKTQGCTPSAYRAMQEEQRR